MVRDPAGAKPGNLESFRAPSFSSIRRGPLLPVLEENKHRNQGTGGGREKPLQPLCWPRGGRKKRKFHLTTGLGHLDFPSASSSHLSGGRGVLGVYLPPDGPTSLPSYPVLWPGGQPLTKCTLCLRGSVGGMSERRESHSHPAHVLWPVPRLWPSLPLPGGRAVPPPWSHPGLWPHPWPHPCPPPTLSRLLSRSLFPEGPWPTAGHGVGSGSKEKT